MPTIDPKDMYWDSCVFYRYLTQNPFEFVDDIHRFMTDANKGERKIYTSTISLAEIRTSFLKKAGHSSAQQFFQDMNRAVILIDPQPNIMAAAGEMKDHPAVNPSDAKTKTQRVMGTADAIHLATCVHLRDVMNVKDIVFNTFDNGKGTTWEGKCVPLLTLERWYPEAQRSNRIREACSLTRILPAHPTPSLFTVKQGSGNGAAPHAQ